MPSGKSSVKYADDRKSYQKLIGTYDCHSMANDTNTKLRLYNKAGLVDAQIQALAGTPVPPDVLFTGPLEQQDAVRFFTAYEHNYLPHEDAYVNLLGAQLEADRRQNQVTSETIRFGSSLIGGLHFRTYFVGQVDVGGNITYPATATVTAANSVQGKLLNIENLIVDSAHFRQGNAAMLFHNLGMMVWNWKWAGKSIEIARTHEAAAHFFLNVDKDFNASIFPDVWRLSPGDVSRLGGNESGFVRLAVPDDLDNDEFRRTVSNQNDRSNRFINSLLFRQSAQFSSFKSDPDDREPAVGSFALVSNNQSLAIISTGFSPLAGRSRIDLRLYLASKVIENSQIGLEVYEITREALKYTKELVARGIINSPGSMHVVFANNTLGLTGAALQDELCRAKIGMCALRDRIGGQPVQHIVRGGAEGNPLNTDFSNAVRHCFTGDRLAQMVLNGLHYLQPRMLGAQANRPTPLLSNHGRVRLANHPILANSPKPAYL